MWLYTYIGMFCYIHFIQFIENLECGSLVVGTLECWYVGWVYWDVVIWLHLL
jgi:hypothetical protein